MSTSKRRRSLACRPGSEALEGRQLLSSSVFRGVDADGDTWTLRLIGPGALQVQNQPGSDGVTPVPIGQAGLIDSIIVQGANPAQTRLVGAVQQSATGDGRVYFNTLSAPAGASPAAGIGVGMLAVDMPQFWLGDTRPDSSTATGTAGTISIPDGVVTLNFGGVDTTAFGLSQNGRADAFTINLGLPTRIGTSIIVDQVITANQEATDSSQQATQDTVTFNVAGRLNVFQANAILGDEALDLGDSGVYSGENTGGTTINSQPPATSSSLTGAIGRFRVGGNATNLTVQVSGTGAALTNFFIGGETNKVSVAATQGVRTAQFGLGMDTVAIAAGQMESLSANRGAVGSSVIVGGDAGSMDFGGDVLNSTILAGYTPGAAGVIDATAQGGGTMTVRVAGDVFDSIFAASQQPTDGIFGGEDDLVIPSGYINAKVEGDIDNSLNPAVDPTAFDTAFFARRVRLEEGPIVPPANQSGPYRPRLGPGRTPGVEGLSGGPRSPAFRLVRRDAARRASGT